MKTIKLSSRLWAEYTRQMRAGKRLPRRQAERWQAEIDQLVLQHLDLVDRIARQVWGRFTRQGQDGYVSHIELADMIAWGRVGLVEAARRYNPEDGAFANYAYRRIRGAMVDAHRRSAYRDMQHASLEVLMPTTEQNLPDAGGHGDRGGRGRQFEAEHLADPAPLPDEQLVGRELQALAMRAIRRLPDDDRVILIDALRGRPLQAVATEQGKSLAWARQRLAAARDQVAYLVKRDQRAA